MFFFGSFVRQWNARAESSRYYQSVAIGVSRRCPPPKDRCSKTDHIEARLSAVEPPPKRRQFLIHCERNGRRSLRNLRAIAVALFEGRKPDCAIRRTSRVRIRAHDYERWTKDDEDEHSARVPLWRCPGAQTEVWERYDRDEPLRKTRIVRAPLNWRRCAEFMSRRNVIYAIPEAALSDVIQAGEEGWLVKL
jgi:hypothetical protein